MILSATNNPVIEGYDKNNIVDLRRHARLIDIDLAAVSDANLQWLLLTAQQLNSVQLLAVISLVPVTDTINTVEHEQHKEQQVRGQIAYNGHDNHEPINNNYRLWLSTLHTLMLHDTIVSQDEYDCLILLAERWLGVRELVD